MSMKRIGAISICEENFLNLNPDSNPLYFVFEAYLSKNCLEVKREY